MHVKEKTHIASNHSMVTMQTQVRKLVQPGKPFFEFHLMDKEGYPYFQKIRLPIQKEDLGY